MANEKRVALVTGGSGGIGRPTALRLAEDGMALAVAYSGNSGEAETVVETIRAGGGSAVAIKCDVGDEASVEAMFEQVEAEFGGIDVVVNTAGIMRLTPLTELSMDDFDAMHHVNVRGAFLVSRGAARRVRSVGAIINFSSSVVKLALPTYTAYAATKGAVDAFTPILAKELRGRDVTVNSVAPGPTATPLFLDGKDQKTIDHLSSMTPLERLGTPDDITEVVSFLAGPARWINGQIIYSNGGLA